MEGLAPPLLCVLSLERALESGCSMRTAVYKWLQTAKCDFSENVRQIVVAHEAGQNLPGRICFDGREDLSQERKAVLEVIARGLHGEPVLTYLRALRDEIELAANLELDEFMAKLPMRALVPLLLLIFPGFLILLFGPLLKTLMKGFVL